MKERLTRYNNIEMSGKKGNASLKVPLQEAINRLAEYEDLEEQGLIVRLPCKVGDLVLIMLNDKLNWYITSTVREIIIQEDTTILKLKNSFSVDVNKDEFYVNAEAEKKLKELKGEEQLNQEQYAQSVENP